MDITFFHIDLLCILYCLFEKTKNNQKGAGIGSKVPKIVVSPTLEDDLKLVSEDFEGGNWRPVFRYDVFPVPRAARELEEVLARVGAQVHRA